MPPPARPPRARPACAETPLRSSGAHGPPRAPRRAVNAFDDAITDLVHRLHAAAPTLGRRQLASVLLRGDLRLAASTVRRRLRRPRPQPPTAPSVATGSETSGARAAASAAPPAAPAAPPAEPPRAARVVTARYPHHVWRVDLTTIPVGLPGTGFCAAWWPFALVLRWLLSWHLVLVLDHFSRSFLAFRLARGEPSAEEVCATLDAAVARAGRAPKHLIIDRVTQFRTEYLEWRRRCAAKPRFRAVGHHGSITVIERSILSLKNELLWRVHVPVRQDAMTALVADYQRWCDEHRPHEAFAGRTPAEMLAGAPPPADRETIEPRERMPPGRAPPRRRARAPLALVVGHVGGRRELPVVAVRDAA